VQGGVVVTLQMATGCEPLVAGFTVVGLGTARFRAATMIASCCHRRRWWSWLPVGLSWQRFHESHRIGLDSVEHTSVEHTSVEHTSVEHTSVEHTGLDVVSRVRIGSVFQRRWNNSQRWSGCHPAHG